MKIVVGSLLIFCIYLLSIVDVGNWACVGNALLELKKERRNEEATKWRRLRF